MTLAEPNFDPEDLPDLRSEIESMRPSAARYMELRGTALQLLDDLDSAYRRLGIAYERLLTATPPREPE